MTKKKVVVKRCVVKKPCPKKDGVVAKRAEKKPLELKAKVQGVRKRGATRSAVAVKPARLSWVGSKKKKRDADKKYRHSSKLLPTTGEFAEVNDLRGDFCVDSEIREIRADLDRITGDDGLIDCIGDMEADFVQDQITGDDSLSERFGGGRHEY